MIFSNFITGARPAASADPRQGSQQQQQQQQATDSCAAAVLGFIDGATGGAATRLRRLRQVSSKQLAINSSKTIGHSSKQVSDSLNIHRQQENSSSGASEGRLKEPVESNDKEAAKGGEWQLKRKYTLNEVQQHSSLDDCWMVIFDKVYNITEFVDEHPGGDFILLEYAGRDATHPFLSSRHGSSAYKMLDKYWIGILVDEELYYSNNSSYCSVYSNLSWRSTPTLEHNDNAAIQTPQEDDRAEASTTTTTTTTSTTFDLHNYSAQTNTSSADSSNSGDEEEEEEEDEEETFEDADDNTEEEDEESNIDDEGLGEALKSSQQACRTCSARSHSSRPKQSYLGRR